LKRTGETEGARIARRRGVDGVAGDRDGKAGKAWDSGRSERRVSGRGERAGGGGGSGEGGGEEEASGRGGTVGEGGCGGSRGAGKASAEGTRSNVWVSRERRNRD